MSSIIDADSLLGVDFGTITTRASLFDVVDGQYRFIASGSAPTTAAPPFLDVGEGLRRALDELRQVTGRAFLDESQNLIMPGRDDGAGVDAFVATASAGPAIRAVVVGLMGDVSLDSARHLAASTYVTIVDQIGLADRRREDQKIDAIIAARPDMVLVAGGTENGASQAVLKLVEIVGLACHLLPESRKPEVLFAGNGALAETIAEKLQGHVKIRTAPNLRPTLDFEDLAPARAELARMFESVREKQVHGFTELARWSGDVIMPTAQAFGQIIRFLSRVYDPAKGVLGVDVGASAVTVAAAFGGDLNLTVRPDLGLGEPLSRRWRLDVPHDVEGISRWLPLDVPDEQVLEYLYNKALNPATLPAEALDLAIEHAITREVIRPALELARTNWDYRAHDISRHSGPRADLLPWFEPIVASGAVFAEAPRPGHTALMLLDALQPTGVTTLVLDCYNLAPVLGAVARLNPTAVVQVLDSGSFVNLGTVITPVGIASPGSAILRVTMRYDTDEEIKVEVRAGSLEVLPLPPGRTARLSLHPLNRFDVGLGPGRPATLKRVSGGTIGLMIDARGRPLTLARDPARRRENNQKWLWDMGSQ